MQLTAHRIKYRLFGTSFYTPIRSRRFQGLQISFESHDVQKIDGLDIVS
jgi:hypothetical protein